MSDYINENDRSKYPDKKSEHSSVAYTAKVGNGSAQA